MRTTCSFTPTLVLAAGLLALGCSPSADAADSGETTASVTVQPPNADGLGESARLVLSAQPDERILHQKASAFDGVEVLARPGNRIHARITGLPDGAQGWILETGVPTDQGRHVAAQANAANGELVLDFTVPARAEADAAGYTPISSPYVIATFVPTAADVLYSVSGQGFYDPAACPDPFADNRLRRGCQGTRALQ